MKVLSSFLVFLMVYSCSSQKRDTKYSFKKDNFEAIALGSTTSLGGPNFYVFPIENFAKSSRSIASTSSEMNITNQKLYLYTLMVQHNVYKATLDFEKDLRICPQFHNDLLTEKEDLSFSQFDSTIEREFMSLSNEDIVYYPELALTIDEKPLYTFIGNSVLTQKYKHALLIKAEQNYQEIQQLCDNGNSDGYFVFTNLIKHIQENPNYLSDKDVYKAVFKIPAIANMLILKGSTKNAEFIDYHPVESEVLSRLNANWIKDYIHTINNYRVKRVSFRSKD